MARPKTQIAPENYYTIYNWMLTELGLSGSELLIYALIFSYSVSKGGKGCYFGGYEAMSLATGCSTKTVQNSIKKLCEIGLVDKKPVTLNSGALKVYLRVWENPLIPLMSLKGMSEFIEILRSFDPVWEDLTQINKNINKVKVKAPRVF